MDKNDPRCCTPSSYFRDGCQEQGERHRCGDDRQIRCLQPGMRWRSAGRWGSSDRDPDVSYSAALLPSLSKMCPVAIIHTDLLILTQVIDLLIDLSLRPTLIFLKRLPAPPLREENSPGWTDWDGGAYWLAFGGAGRWAGGVLGKLDAMWRGVAAGLDVLDDDGGGGRRGSCGDGWAGAADGTGGREGATWLIFSPDFRWKPRVSPIAAKRSRTSPMVTRCRGST